jgi:hypothetical protein
MKSSGSAGDFHDFTATKKQNGSACILRAAMLC